MKVILVNLKIIAAFRELEIESSKLNDFEFIHCENINEVKNELINIPIIT